MCRVWRRDNQSLCQEINPNSTSSCSRNKHLAPWLRMHEVSTSTPLHQCLIQHKDFILATYKVLAVVLLPYQVFRDVTPCRCAKRARHFKVSWCPRVQSQAVQKKNRPSLKKRAPQSIETSKTARPPQRHTAKHSSYQPRVYLTSLPYFIEV